MPEDAPDRAPRSNDYPQFCRPSRSRWGYEDPLQEDDVDDVAVSVTRRGLARIALVASEVGASFDRCDTALDPMEWMSAPRRLFGGAAAMDACLDLGDCLRAILLHQLDAGPDADSATIEALLEDEDDDGRVMPPRQGYRLKPDATSSEVTEPYSSRMPFRDDILRTWGLEPLTAPPVEDRRCAFVAQYGMTIARAECIAERSGRTGPHPKALVSQVLVDARGFASLDPRSPMASGQRVEVRQWAQA